MALAAGVVSLVALAMPSPSVADAGHDADAKANTGSGQPLTWWEALSSGLAGHHIELLYPTGSPDLDRRVAPSTPSPAGSSSTIDRPPEYVQIALGGLGGVTIAAAGWTLRGRRRRQPLLEAALASGGSDELSRAAGLLGDRLVQHGRTDAAAHAYRAAVDVGDEYWSPIAQVALARLLCDQGDREEAQALLEAVTDSGHPRAVPAAQSGLVRLMTGRSGAKIADLIPDRRRWECLGGPEQAPLPAATLGCRSGASVSGLSDEDPLSVHALEGERGVAVGPAVLDVVAVADVVTVRAERLCGSAWDEEHGGGSG